MLMLPFMLLVGGQQRLQVPLRVVEAHDCLLEVLLTVHQAERLLQEEKQEQQEQQQRGQRQRGAARRQDSNTAGPLSGKAIESILRDRGKQCM
jgi:hypothetical protein